MPMLVTGTGTELHSQIGCLQTGVDELVLAS
jgi:hypothetical protein